VGFRVGLLVWFQNLRRRRSHLRDLGEQDGVPGIFLLYPLPIRSPNHFDAKQIGSLAFVEDDENLREETLTLSGLQGDYLIDQRWKKSALDLGHFFTG